MVRLKICQWVKGQLTARIRTVIKVCPHTSTAIHWHPFSSQWQNNTVTVVQIFPNTPFIARVL